MNNVLYYRSQLLSKLNKVDPQPVPNPITYCTREQAVKLHELGVNPQERSGYYHDVFFHIGVLPGSVPDSERSQYSVREDADEDGFTREYLIEDTHAILGEEVNKAVPDVALIKWEFDFYNIEGNEDKYVLHERVTYPAYSPRALGNMLTCIGQPSLIPKGIETTSAEYLANVLIDFLSAASEEDPNNIKIQFNADKADYSSPEYKARIEKLKTELEGMRNMNKPYQHPRTGVGPRGCGCNCCTCRNNRVYGKRGK